MINVSTTSLEQLLNWSPPMITTTVRGQRSLRTATPNAAFWGLWRSNRQAIKDLGIDVRPQQDGSWQCKWWTGTDTTPVAPVAAPSVPSTPSVPVVKANTNAKPISRTNSKGYAWSDEQMNIFTWFRDGSGSLVVRARAGTGKTTTIKTAFTYAPEARMLYAVFNKKNQLEAASAIQDPRVEIKTLHALGFMFIQAVWPNVKPTDDVETERVLRAVGLGSMEAGENTPTEVRTAVKKLVGFAKNMIVNPNVMALVELANERGIDCEQFESIQNGGWTVTKLAECVMRVLDYSEQRDPEGRVSFNDMVWLPVRKGWVRAWFDMVVVDEAQDMNLPQLLMAKGAVKTGGRVCIVGDDRQAIYGFRGACSDGMDMMKRELNATELGLTITYRCPKKVVAMAQAIVPDYRAADAAPEGAIEQIVDTMIANNVQVGDAILSRANAPLMPVCLNLLRKGIAARIEGRDIGKMLLGIVERLNARTVPQFLSKVETWVEKQKNRFRDTKNFESKAQEIDDQAQTLIAVAEGASSVTEIKDRLSSLFQDSANSRTPAVVLSSVHKAKGLEWNKVLLLTWTFNKKPAGATAPSIEEQNIYYVGLTRAKNTLVMVQDSKTVRAENN